jgi:hypothetical protein
MQNIQVQSKFDVHCEGVTQIFKENSPEGCEVMCQCCIKLKHDLQEAITELKSTREIIQILQEELDTAKTMELRAQVHGVCTMKKNNYFLHHIPITGSRYQ